MTFGLRVTNAANIVQIDEKYRNMGWRAQAPATTGLYGARVMAVGGGVMLPGEGDSNGGSFGLRVHGADGHLVYDSRWKQFYIHAVHRLPGIKAGSDYDIPTPDGTDDWVLSHGQYFVEYDLQSKSGTPDGPFEAWLFYPQIFVQGGFVRVRVPFDYGGTNMVVADPPSSTAEPTLGNGFSNQAVDWPLNFNVFVGKLI
jgi:hypothetical protein